MIRLVILLLTLNIVFSSVIYIDRSTVDSNTKYSNWSTAFTHDENQNAIVNVTMQISKPLAKLLVYVKVGLAENEHDRECKREFLRTVFDVEKVCTSSRMNFLVAAFLENLKRFFDFEMIFPLVPVSGVCLNFFI